MNMKVEPQRTGEHLASEASGTRSREQGVLAEGNLPPATVLAEISHGNYVQLDPAADDGTETAKAILYAGKDATAGPVDCVVHVRDCEMVAELLNWPEGITDAQKTAALNDLESLGVIAR